SHFFSFINRKQRRREHPTSPNKYRKCSRRCFDGQLRTWRRNLHQFDEENENNKQELTDTIEMPNIDEINQPISIDDQATR
ncbi:unnamed protein product, partial [Rotaria magnacalcarata]